MKENTSKVIEKTCSAFGITIEELLSRKRTEKLFLARMAFAKIAYYSCGLSMSKIGKIINKHHTTISTYISLYHDEYRYNKVFRTFVDAMGDIDIEIKTDFHREIEQELNEIIG